jgi:hypothetical protein
MNPNDPEIISIADRYLEDQDKDQRVSFYDRDPLTLARTHTLRVLALLEAIDRGELLSALPKDADSRARHENAVALLDIVRDEARTVLDCFRRLGVSED